MASESPRKAYTDAAYVEILTQERHMYAWTLETFGGYDRAVAEARAVERYPYDPVEQNNPFLFHDRAWHYAMIELHGATFWTSKPELLNEPAEYYVEEDRFGFEARSKEFPAH